MARELCGATYEGRSCTLRAGHGGSIHTELTKVDERATASFSWAYSMGQPAAIAPAQVGPGA